jgi:hypothetical protein
MMLNNSTLGDYAIVDMRAYEIIPKDAGFIVTTIDDLRLLALVVGLTCFLAGFIVGEFRSIKKRK